MTILLPDSAAGTVDALLRGGLRDLDISDAEHAAVVSHYTALGEEYEHHWSATLGHNVIFAQGSFALGTVVRNIHRNDDIDIDLVAVRDIAKSSISQAGLKADAGVPPRTYARSARSGRPALTQCTRCWTLTWAGMHLDILPAVPDAEAGGTNIWITDRDVRQWLPSNPGGYAEWYRRQMREEFLAHREVLAKSMQVDDVPDYHIKTTLQQSTQALKRHRDIYFADRLDDRPASVVITTLAGLAYPGGGELYEVLRTVTAKMGEHLSVVNGQWVLCNPSQPGENFTDSWRAYPERARHLFEWLDVAARDFDGLGSKSGLDQAVPALEHAFGNRFAKAASAALSEPLHGGRGRMHMSATGGLIGAATATSGRIREHGFAGGSAQ